EHRADPTVAFALSRLADNPIEPTPVGVFRAVERASYESEVQHQLAAAQENRGPGDLGALIGGPSVWEVA
ncbi:MAG: 2-oxoacid:ferredoxin oxidoreductase subunit beta, partial [Acidimicrobiia bacterium]